MLIIPDIRAAACMPRTLLETSHAQQHTDHSTRLCVLERDVGSPMRVCHRVKQPQIMTIAEENAGYRTSTALQKQQEQAMTVDIYEQSKIA